MAWGLFHLTDKTCVKNDKATCQQQSLKNTRSFWHLTVSLCKKKMKRTFNSRICSCCALHIRIVELIFYTQITNKPWLCNSCTVKMLCWNDCSYHYSFISGNLHWPWLFWKILRDSYLCLCKWSMVITLIFTRISIINWLLYYKYIYFGHPCKHHYFWEWTTFFYILVYSSKGKHLAKLS